MWSRVLRCFSDVEMRRAVAGICVIRRRWHGVNSILIKWMHDAAKQRSNTVAAGCQCKTPSSHHVRRPAYSIFLLFPLGAGSKGAGAVASTGVRLYVTVLVTTCLTLTARVVLPPTLFFSRSHDRGDMVAEYGE